MFQKRLAYGRVANDGHWGFIWGSEWGPVDCAVERTHIMAPGFEAGRAPHHSQFSLRRSLCLNLFIQI